MQEIRLWSEDAPLAKGSEAGDIPTITPYVVETSKPGPAILVCPGGGYAHLAAHEGEPVALWLNQLGISAFVLSYRLAPYRFPVPLIDGQRAMRWIRHRARELGVDPERVGAIGFSAGGHLAAMLSNPPQKGTSVPSDLDAVDSQDARPNLSILAYAVTIIEGPKAHGTARNLFGDGTGQDSDIWRQCSIPDLVSDANPPTFVWHTAEDTTVPVHHALKYAEELAKHEIPFALHVFQRGRHGLGLDPENQGAQAWTELVATWLGSYGFTQA